MVRVALVTLGVIALVVGPAWGQARPAPAARKPAPQPAARAGGGATARVRVE